MKDRIRSIPRQGFLLGGLAVLCVSVILWAVLSASHGGDSSKATPEKPPSSSPTVSPSPIIEAGDSDPAALQQDKQSIEAVVEAFTKIYFAVDPSESATDIKQKVRPYVTSSFLKNSSFGLGNSAADDAVRRNGTTIRVKPITAFISDFIDRKTVEGFVTLEATTYDKSGNVTESHAQDQRLVLVKQGEHWLVFDTPLI